MADDCRVPPDRQEWDKLLKDLRLSGPRQGQSNSRRGRGGGRGGNRGQGGGGGAGQQENWPQQQQPFQGNPGKYSIQQQQVLPPPGMMIPPQIPGGEGGGGQCPPPNITWGTPLGQQQQPPPPQSPAVQQPGPCGQPGAFVLDPNNSQFGGDVRRLQRVTFSVVGTGYNPSGSASTPHDPFALLREERRRYRLYGQINTINALEPAAARTRPTLLVQLRRIHIEVLVDTGASTTVINEKTFSQVPDKDKVRLCNMHTWEQIGTHWSHETPIGHSGSV